MFTFAKSATLITLLAAAAPAFGQVSTADVALDGSTECPLPENAGDIGANVLAVVHFEETATATALGLVSKSVPASLDVCLCLQSDVATGGTVSLPTALQADVKSQTAAYIELNAAVDTAVGAVKTVLDSTGGALTVTVAPSSDIDACVCSANSIPGCSDGGCFCQPCDDGETYSPLLGVCVAIIVDPLPGPSQAAGLANRMARARRSAEASVFAKYQAKRSDIVSRVARMR